MLAKIAPRFVIAGVIQNAYYANYMTIEVAKQIFGDSCRDFRMEDSKRYNVSLLLYRNATSLAICLPSLLLLSSLVSTKLKNMRKPSKSLLSTMMSKRSIPSSTSSHLK